MGLFKGFGEKTKSFLFGKKANEEGFATMPEDPAQAAARAEGYAAQRDAMNTLKGMPGAEQQAGIEGQSKINALSGGLSDITRRIQQLQAQRGLSGTSIGMGQQIGAERNVQNKMADIQASLPERIRQLRESRALQMAQLGQGMVGSAGQQQVYQNTRQGGFLPAIMKAGGAAAGAAFGGAMGAKAGGTGGETLAEGF